MGSGLPKQDEWQARSLRVMPFYYHGRSGGVTGNRAIPKGGITLKKRKPIAMATIYFYRSSTTTSNSDANISPGETTGSAKGMRSP